MDMIHGKLTSKFQVTVPKKVRDILMLDKGSEIAYEILDDHTVILKKVYPLDAAYLKSLNQTLTEWESKEHDKAYRNLSSL